MADATVLIVDDQPFILCALQTFIENEDGMSVAGTVEGGEVAIEAAKPLQLGPVLVDVKMPRLDGIEITRKIVPRILGTWVLALTTFSILDYAVPTPWAGTAGYLAKDTRPDEVLVIIRSTMDDSLSLSPPMVRSMARRVIGGALDTQAVTRATVTEAGLALRKTSVLQFLGNGLSDHKIAKKMYILEGSVKTYLANICTKLGIRDRLQVVIRGFELGIASPRLSASE